MSNPEQNEAPQNPGGARTLGGAAADTSLPAGWGQKKKMLGRVGDWGDSGAGSWVLYHIYRYTEADVQECS